MSTPLKYFLSQKLQFNPSEDIYYLEPEYEIDDRNYVIIDGEEADYGSKDHYHKGFKLCTYYKQGDNEWYEYTEAGKKCFGDIARKLFEEEIQKVNVCTLYHYKIKYPSTAEVNKSWQYFSDLEAISKILQIPHVILIEKESDIENNSRIPVWKKESI